MHDVQPLRVAYSKHSAFVCKCIRLYFEIDARRPRRQKQKGPGLATEPFEFRWWSGGGSNSRPSHCERDALPAELPPHQSSIIHTHFRAWQ
ncbi:hypothetical protein BSLA_01f0073 [Burkholderia stabilis]|nr:hypothetical protein BSLA_01f0073 [Burkholderia stabilis]